MSLHDRLHEIIEPIVTELGLELFDLNYAGSTLSVIIDRRRSATAAATTDAGANATDPDGAPGSPEPEGPARSGVDIAAITAVTRSVSRALDEHDPISAHYSLEVSSPGLERLLRTPTHFAGAVGEVVSIKTVARSELPRRIKGVLIRAGSGARRDRGEDIGDVASTASDPELTTTVAVRAEPDDEVLTVPYDAIEKARTVFEWGPDAKPSRPPKPTKTAKPSKPSKSPKPGTAKSSTPSTSGAPSPSTSDSPPNVPADDKKVTAT